MGESFQVLIAQDAVTVNLELPYVTVLQQLSAAFRVIIMLSFTFGDTLKDQSPLFLYKNVFIFLQALYTGPPYPIEQQNEELTLTVQRTKHSYMFI